MKLPCLRIGALGALVAVPGRAAASEALAQQAGCVACHALDKKSIGPSYKEIAARYKGDAKAAALLAGRVRQGSQGVWGPLPMPPTPAARLNDAQLKALVEWVLRR